MSRSTGPRGRQVAPTSQALEAVRRAPTILTALRRMDHLSEAASRDASAQGLRELKHAVVDPADAVTALAAVHALAALPRGAGAPSLVALLRSGDAFRAEHAAWALADADPVPSGLPHLVAMVSEGGLTGMLAQRTLELWAPSVGEQLVSDLAAALSTESEATGRARLVETAGLVPGEGSTDLLLAAAGDPDEPDVVRAAAVAALGDRGSPDGVVVAALTALAASGGALAPVATLALADLAARADVAPRAAVLAAPPRARARAPHGGGPGGDREVRSLRGQDRRAEPPGAGAPAPLLTVAQLFLHADIDGGLTSAGKGDTGGIATLLVHLGDALLDGDGEVGRVITISRGRPTARPVPEGLASPGHHYAQVPFWGPPLGLADAWSHRVAARRGIRRVLCAAGRVDVLHLRMADVGSMAAAEVARELGIPVVLTVAPDPQALMAARETAGALSRSSFGSIDAAEHLAFRDRLLRDLADQAEHLVLFPRPDLERDSRELLGLEIARHDHRTTVVAEGIDLRVIDRASASLRAALDPAKAADAPPSGDPVGLADLDALLEALPPHRRSLPLAVTVGRLHRVKGMATLVEAWAGHPDLANSCNLLVIGGDLGEPSRDEQAELARIDGAIARSEAAGQGLLLAGHRPNAVVATWLAAARQGRPGRCGQGGIYVSASLKEEFGLAILEAMASSLVVVAPDGGGPATYVAAGVTGILTDTTSPAALASAMVRALGLASSPESPARAAELAGLRGRFSITAMATALGRVYAEAADGYAVAHAGGPCAGASAHRTARAAEGAAS